MIDYLKNLLFIVRNILNMIAYRNNYKRIKIKEGTQYHYIFSIVLTDINLYL
jgi:hypothetical protein